MGSFLLGGGGAESKWPRLLIWKLSSKWAHFICLCIPNGRGSILENAIFALFYPLFDPKTAHCQGNLAFWGGQKRSPLAQSGLEPLVLESHMVW